MEAASLYERFENNVDAILSLLQGGLDIRTTPFQSAIPLEVNLLCDILNHAGVSWRVNTEGIGALEEFRGLYLQNKPAVLGAMHTVLQDKKSFMRAPGGSTVLLKEMLIRRLEYFNETARSLKIMRNQQVLGSPKQYTYVPQLTAGSNK